MKRLRAGRRSGSLCHFWTAVLTVSVHAQLCANDAPDSSPLEEVIVTARKVPENVQDIPISVQVLTGEQLDDLDLSVLFDLQYEVPGLIVISTGGNGAAFALRGVADQGGTQDSVAIHLNGVYLGNSSLSIARLFDLERVEVLKGPQGTLYGRNSTAGTLNFISRAPEDTFGGNVEGAYGSFNTARVQGYVNAPLGDTVAFRFAFIGSDGDGYIRNTVDDRHFAEQDYWGLRGSLRFEPDERWRIDLVAQHTYDDGAANELWLPNPRNLPDPDDIHLTRVTLADPFLIIENDNVNLTADYDFGFAQLRSITGYARNETNNKDDCAGTPELQGCVRGGDPNKFEQWSQEVQLASDSAETLNWLAGAYFFSGESYRFGFQGFPNRFPQWLNNNLSTSDSKVWALFGQTTLHFGDGWGVTGGLRYTHEKSEISNIGFGLRDNHDLVEVGDDYAHPSWLFNIEYQAFEDSFVYAGLSTGFKSGGITTFLLPEGDYNQFDPENLLAFEAGIKKQWPERGAVLDAAAFHYDFDDLQTDSVYFVDDVNIVETENASQAVVYGLDIAGSVMLTDRLELSGGVIWLPKREFVDFTSTRTNQNLTGNKLRGAPEWSGIVSLAYVLPVTGHGQLTTTVQYSYRSSFYYTKENVDPYSQDAHGLLNLLLHFEPASGAWYAFATGRNLTDEDYFHQVFFQSTPGYPDTYEVGVGWRF